MSEIGSLRNSPAIYSFRRRWFGTGTYWLLQGVGWGAVFLIGMVPVVFDPLLSAGLLQAQLSFQLAYGLSGLILSHLLRVVVVNYLARLNSWGAFALGMLPWTLALAGLLSLSGVVVTLMLYARYPQISNPYVPGISFAEIAARLTIDLPLMVIWGGFYLGIRAYRQTRMDSRERVKLKAALNEAELRTLKAQLDPHFLFNSLNSLRALISESDVRAREAVTRLADLLRSTLDASRLSEVSLSDEWSTTQNYLHIEHLRRGTRLRWRSHFEPDSLRCRLPPLVLQGLVENALKHGLDRREAGGEIDIRGRVHGNVLELTVTNPGLLDPGTSGNGMGLANARSRLSLVFGPGASLQLSQGEADMVIAEVIVPQAGSRSKNQQV
jgi:two-component system, LytTR family, sensor kinase